MFNIEFYILHTFAPIAIAFCMNVLLFIKLYQIYKSFIETNWNTLYLHRYPIIRQYIVLNWIDRLTLYCIIDMYSNELYCTVLHHSKLYTYFLLEIQQNFNYTIMLLFIYFFICIGYATIYFSSQIYDIYLIDYCVCTKVIKVSTIWHCWHWLYLYIYMQITLYLIWKIYIVCPQMYMLTCNMVIITW